jgi:hypothetical protein
MLWSNLGQEKLRYKQSLGHRTTHDELSSSVILVDAVALESAKRARNIRFWLV